MQRQVKHTEEARDARWASDSDLSDAGREVTPHRQVMTVSRSASGSRLTASNGAQLWNLGRSGAQHGNRKAETVPKHAGLHRVPTTVPAPSPGHPEGQRQLAPGTAGKKDGPEEGLPEARIERPTPPQLGCQKLTRRRRTCTLFYPSFTRWQKPTAARKLKGRKLSGGAARKPERSPTPHTPAALARIGLSLLCPAQPRPSYPAAS